MNQVGCRASKCGGMRCLVLERYTRSPTGGILGCLGTAGCGGKRGDHGPSRSWLWTTVANFALLPPPMGFRIPVITNELGVSHLFLFSTGRSLEAAENKHMDDDIRRSRLWWRHFGTLGILLEREENGKPGQAGTASPDSGSRRRRPSSLRCHAV